MSTRSTSSSSFSSPLSSPASSAHPPSDVSTFQGLAPVVAAVFLGFLAVSFPLGALSLQVRDALGFGPATVGWVIGLQSIATLLSRHQAGTLSDRRGTRVAVLLGLPVAACSGLAYILSALLPLDAQSRLGLLLLGRIAMGVGESLFLTGLMTWGIARVGPARTGKVMSWVGIAIYAALGLGAPAGLALQASLGFVAVGAATVITPLLALCVVAPLKPLRPVAASGGQRVAFHRVLGLIWRPGLVLALATVPYAALAAFLTLAFATRGWSHAGLALLGFAIAYVCVRLFGSGLPDRHGATKVAVGSLLFEALGQLLLWFAPSPAVAVAGATLTGLGFSLVFPAMGVLATRAVPPEQRGRAVGNFIAFADIALGVTGPVAGLATHGFGIAAAFGVGAAATIAALCLLPSFRLGDAR